MPSSVESVAGRLSYGQRPLQQPRRGPRERDRGVPVAPAAGLVDVHRVDPASGPEPGEAL